jgi:gamma-tubulin complex component 5
MELMNPPAPSTLAHADIVLSGERETISKAGKLTWAQIMAEEPFEGEHWEGIFGPKTPYNDDSDSLSDELSSEFDEPPESNGSAPTSPSVAQDRLLAPVTTLSTGALVPYAELFRGSSLEGREVAERLRKQQYWWHEWEADTRWDRPFNLADPSTLAATADRLIYSRPGIDIIPPKVSLHYDYFRFCDDPIR